MLAGLRVVVVFAALLVLATESTAQDPYALRTSIGSEAYLWELRANQAQLRSRGTPKPNAAAPTRLSGQFTPQRPSIAAQHAQNAMNFWAASGGHAPHAGQTLAQPPARPSFVRQASATAPAKSTPPTASSKPFAGADRFGAPTVSPYLQLFREEFEEAAPNYHAFVRPGLERQQQRERQQRRRRDPLQAAPAASPTTASLPTGGLHSSRFGNTGSFYSGWQR